MVHAVKCLLMLFEACSFAIIVSGCAINSCYQAYPGNPLPPEKTAKIIGGAQLGGSNRSIIYIWRVDEHPTAYTFGGTALSPVPTETQVLPGKHTISVTSQMGNTSAGAHLWLIADVGRKYLVRSVTKGYAAEFWIEDESTGKRVGGVQGCTNDPPQKLNRKITASSTP